MSKNFKFFVARVTNCLLYQFHSVFKVQKRALHYTFENSLLFLIYEIQTFLILSFLFILESVCLMFKPISKFAKNFLHMQNQK